VGQIAEWSDLCPDWAREGWPRTAAWIVLADVLAGGVFFVIELATEVGWEAHQLAVAQWGGFAGMTSSAAEGASVLELVTLALPLLSIPLAARIMARIDWTAIEERVGWFPSRRQERLGTLGLAAWLAWPFRMPETLLTEARTRAWSEDAGLTLLAAVVVTALVYLFFFYRPQEVSEPDDDLR
jgi:hypothetical protein